MSDTEYHLHRARVERGIAYRSALACASDAHMRLSALHLQRALLLQQVVREPVGNVSPLRPSPETVSSPGLAAAASPLIELPSYR